MDEPKGPKAERPAGNVAAQLRRMGEIAQGIVDADAQAKGEHRPEP